MFLTRSAICDNAASWAQCSSVWSLASALLLLCACEKNLTDNECDLLLDHYTANLMRNESPDVTPAVISEKQQAARELAHRDPAFEFDRCGAAVSRRQFDCAMTANDVDSIERCLTL